MKLVKEFNQYLANLAVVTFKLHNVHWNTVGTQFVQVHKYTEELYDETFEFFDAVAEILKMNDVTPDSRLSDYLKNATISEGEKTVFDCREAYEVVLADLKALREEANALRNACDAEGWFTSATLFEDQIESYNKRIWFVKSILAAA